MSRPEQKGATNNRFRVSEEKESVMKQRDDDGRESRRTFLKSMALTGGGVAVAASVGQAVAAQEEGATTLDQPAPTGYHETQHIRDYYARAQF